MFVWTAAMPGIMSPHYPDSSLPSRSVSWPDTGRCPFTRFQTLTPVPLTLNLSWHFRAPHSMERHCCASSRHANASISVSPTGQRACAGAACRSPVLMTLMRVA